MSGADPDQEVSQGSGFLADLAADAEAWRAQGLQRQRRVVESPTGPWIEVAGQGRRLSFLSNDYLGLASDHRLRQAIAEGALRWGAGSGASALISGHLGCHAEAEAAIAEFLGCPAALLFITGYMANLAVVTSLVQGPDDVVFSDALNHASLIDGCRLSRAQVVRFPHRDLVALAEVLANTPARRRLIVTDAVFSMDGTVADVHGLLSLAERFDALLLLDDAHGFGVLGPDGRGTAAAAGVRSERLLVMGTLGKAAGLSGAFVAGAAVVVEHLIQHGRTYVFSTAPAPAVAAAVVTALGLIASGDWRRQHLIALRESLVARSTAWQRRPADGGTPIVPVVVGRAQSAVTLSRRLATGGVLVAAIRPPTVPPGTSRLRISLSAAHSMEDLELLLAQAEACSL